MKSSVTESLKIVLCYLLFGVLGAVVCGVFYMVYALCLDLVAGQTITSFSAGYFLKGLIVCTPLVFEGMVLTLIFYVVRHPVSGAAPIIVLVVVSLFSWFGIAPFMNSMIAKNEAKEAEQPVIRNVSPGYFRFVGENLVYFSKIDDQNVVQGVCVDLMGSQEMIYTFDSQQLGASVDNANTLGFRDSLIQNSLQAPGILRMVYSGLCVFQALQVKEIQKGYLNWLFYALCGCSLIASCGLRKISGWRMNNISLIVGAWVLILFMNVEFYLPEGIMHNAVASINNALSFIKFMENPCAVIFNVLCCIIGLVCGIVGGSKARRSEEV